MRDELRPLLAVALLFGCLQISAAAADEKREDSDWSNRLKHMRLNDDGTVYLSLGGELRERYEYYNEPLFGVRSVHQDDYLLHRLLLNLDLRAGDHVRIFLEMGNHLELGKEAPRSPTDVDELDFQQAFLDLVIPFDERSILTLRSGRQQMILGSGRLVSVREGSNVRRSFDGARLMFNQGEATFDAFLVRTVRLQVGAFNDEPEPDETFWGGYGVIPLSALPDGHLDLYYLGLERKEAVFQQGVAGEKRHSFGARLWGTPGAWDYNYEVVVQTGSFGDADILAWTFASDAGYTFASALFSPRLGLKADIASGDSSLVDDQLNTFNALFPKQPYFSEASLLAPANIIDLHPSIALHFTETVSLTTDIDLFWKQQGADAIYAPPGRPLIQGGPTESRYIGAQVNAALEWEINRHLSMTFYYSHFFAGSAVTGAGGHDVDFVGSWINFRF